MSDTNATNTSAGPDLAAGIDAGTLVDGVPLVGHANGEAVLVVKTAGRIAAVGATCSHYGGPLGEGLIVGDTIRCPWHHACFNLSTGAVERAPALNPIPCYRVETIGPRIRVLDRQPVPTPAGGGATSQPVGVGGVGGDVVKSIVIVGAGAAGHTAAEVLRRRGYEGSITLLGRDPAAPYDRPNLSKDFLAGNAPEEWIPLRPPEFYAQQDITLRTGIAVSSIDVLARAVQLSDGGRTTYDRLLLATGADPVSLPIPGADAPFVHVLRTLDDCRALIRAAGSARRVVIVGSGFIGLEAAAALRNRNLEVTVVSPESEPLARVIGSKAGAFLRELHQRHGVVFQLGQKVTAIESGAVVTAAGLRLSADLVLVGIGVLPMTTLAESAGVIVDKGLLVDEFLETNIGGIFAAGDVARFPDPRTGARIRVEHWVVAQRMGAIAAENMLGARRKFDAIPFFWSVHYDITLSYVGHTEAAADSLQVEIEGSLPDGDCRIRYRQDGRVMAVLTVGRDRESLLAERSFETGA